MFLLKLFFDKFMYAIVNYWRVILFGLMALAMFHYKTAYEAKTQELKAFKSEAAFQLTLQKTLLHQRELEIAKDRNEATKTQENIKLHYEKQIADLNLDRANIKKELNNALPRISSLLDAVKLYQNRSNISGVSENGEYSKLLTESAGDCNSTVAVLTKAGQSCALDYQALYEWVLSEKKAINGE